jgi:hypothetical protein
MAFMALLPTRLSTETPFFQDLIADISGGQIKIPQFQRKFVWKEEQAFRLLDSIKNNYPIGSLLIWRTTVRLAAERNIGNFQLPKTDDMMPTDYVLDGQQRITVIYSSVGAPDTAQGFSPGYDLANEEFVLLSDASGPTVFPLRWIYDTTHMLNFRTALLTRPDGTELQGRLDHIVDAFTKYRIPVVTLKDLTIDEVCPIFERINSSGTKLSIYDLMVAATWSENFDLNHHVDRIAESLRGKSFEKIERDTILKCLAAVQFGSVKQSDILALRDLDVELKQLLVDRVREGLLQAVDLLATEFGIYNWDFLPYEAVLVIVCRLCCEGGIKSGDALKKLRQWFWRSGFTERYRVGGENFVSKDIEAVSHFVRGQSGVPDDFGQTTVDENLRWMRIQFRSNNSISRAFILALASKHPRSLITGRVIDTTVALSKYNKKEFHHIFPMAYLKRISAPGQHNCLANICMLPASENGQISDADPHQYILQCTRGLGAGAEEIFASNLLPSPQSFPYSSASLEDFTRNRSLLISQLVQNLCDGRES